MTRRRGPKTDPMHTDAVATVPAPTSEPQSVKRPKQQRFAANPAAAAAPTQQQGQSNGQQRLVQPVAEQPQRPTVDSQYLTQVTFSSLATSDATKRAMQEVFGYQYCSKVQAEAIPPCLAGKDVLAKARTGTGKTLAFGIPAVEKLLQHPQPGKVSVLVLSPTRELAQQIQVEMDKLLHFHKMESQVVYGGVPTSRHVNAIKRRVPEILMATPGRCLDLMTSDDAASLRGIFSNVQLLVLDEADNLLDMGFRPQLNRILACIPEAAKRQTFLFSATFPEDVKDLAGHAMRKQYTFVDTVGAEVNTHQHVDQSMYVTTQDALLMQLYHVLRDHIKREPDYKILVFFVTANLTALYSSVFELLGLPVLEMHSRLSQTKRDKISDEFRKGSRMVMFSSDVSARGVDYPNISCVVQVGCPQSREQYIHRTGRTGRAGRDGEAVLLLTDFETSCIGQLKSLPIQRMEPLGPAELQEAANGPVGTAMAAAWDQAPASEKAKGYQSWLGYYKSAAMLGRCRPEELVQRANHFSQIMGMAEPPALEAKTIGKMGLKGVPGLRVAPRDASAAGGGGRGGGGGGRNGGGGGGGSNFYQEPAAPRQQYNGNGGGSTANGGGGSNGYNGNSMNGNGAGPASRSESAGGRGGGGRGGRGGGRGGGGGYGGDGGGAGGARPYSAGGRGGGGPAGRGGDGYAGRGRAGGYNPY